ncbi:ATP phosphoribosyltransferase regulatory subunit [Erythrobacter sp. LQ02-29]|uniref:ATP phosphoribosyltransferase regulatory subunit n=1 Tax=Erythrobacter sp. LQ02-29 TaxID=2920384 RepID=UPI001F4E1EA6|nr:ATP phosphoribosyltransferase regulatory subunit [Erythrobacter sp. LQ02-29]MCP9222565.1 ATP phosphoribosyltransferase regulatory subunit [Erythrobacter sp. LQ02-29]
MTEPEDLLPIGLEDRLPREAAAITRAMREALDAMDAHGYDRVRPPLIEFERSLAGRMGHESARTLCRFVDPASLRTLAVRSDITPQIGRIADTGLSQAPRPLRLCYAGEVAVLSADQLDPARQRLQLGAELVGADTLEAISEILSLAVETLEAMGAKGLTIDLTLPDLVDTLAAGPMPLAPERVEPVKVELDSKDAGGLVAAGGETYLPLIHATGPVETALERLRAIDAGGALASRIEGIEKLAKSLQGRARVTLDPTERHGFKYYSWFGFTAYGAGASGALARGGTYRVQRSGEAATGFTCYLDRLLPALPPAPARDMLFLPTDHDPAVARRLRAEGWRTLKALTDGDDPRALGCTHRLAGAEPTPL